MSKQHGFDVRIKRIYTDLRPYLPSPPVLAASALVILGAGFLFFLPDSDGVATSSTAASSASAPITPDETLCDRQAWPYMDQRCAARVDAARGSRQVRIVTDKGNSVKTVTPLPTIEKKPVPEPRPQPAMAQTSPQIGPPVAPTVGNAPSEPQTTGSVQPAAASAQPATASSPSTDAAKAMASTNVPPTSASTAPVSPGVNAIEEKRPKSKSARAAERAEKREAEKAKKRDAKQRRIEQDDDDGAQDVADAARSVPEGRSDRSRSRRARGEVPDEVIDAVEAAAARDRGRTVSVESPRGRRVYVVPSDGGGW